MRIPYSLASKNRQDELCVNVTYMFNATWSTEAKLSLSINMMSSSQGSKENYFLCHYCINNGLHSLHIHSNVSIVVSRRCLGIFLFVCRLHLLNGRRVYNGHFWKTIVREPSLHLPVLLTQGAPVQAAVHTACITRWILQS